MDVLGENLSKAAATANIRMGITAIVAILASCLSDAYVGRYQMLLCEKGLSLIALAASKHQINTFCVGLLFIACGKGGHSPMLKDFGADQLKSSQEEDEDDTRVNKRVNFWWCTSVTLGAFAGIILLAIVESNQHWGLVYGLLSITMSFAICMFISSKPFYTCVEPCGSVLSRVLRVFVAAFLNKHLSFPPNTSHPDGLRFLDKAAIAESASTQWRLCTVTEVEETKLLVRMIPMWTTFLVYGSVKSLGSTFFLQQGSNMNRKLHHGNLPLPLLLLFTRYVSGQITWLIKRVSKKFPAAKQVINPKRRIAIGMVFGVLCCTVASLVEEKRLNVVKRCGLQDRPKETLPISVFWLTPQFLLMGAMDGFTYLGIKDFFDDQVPKTMKSFVPSFAASVVGVGSLLSVIVIAASDKVSSREGRPSWFADTINKSRLDYFYQTFTVLSYINLIIYGFVSSKYTYMTTDTENEQSIDVVDTMSF